MVTSLLFVFGTRPEAIKMAPLIRLFRQDPRFDARVCTTGQHRSMAADVLEVFGIVPDHDLDVMRDGQIPSGVTVAVLQRLAPVLESLRRDWVFVQGDTTSTFAASLAAFYARVRVAHLEAGLRTWDPASPYPEEMNRVLTSRLATVHFAPTDSARENLLREGIDADQVHVTGNTVVDALLAVDASLQQDPALRARMERRFAFLDPAKRLLLATAHRRESFGEGIASICRALARIASAHPDVEIVLPVHPNPAVREPIRSALGGVARIHLVDPLDYVAMVFLMGRAHLVLTDSGGIQEEAPALGKPVLVMRDKTERMEGVEGGSARIVGTSEESIASGAAAVLTDGRAHALMARQAWPYGGEGACRRIVNVMAAMR